MTQFESSIKIIPANIEIIFNTISDLKNLEKIKDRLPVDKIQDFSCDTDSCSFSINPVGSLRIKNYDENLTKRSSLKRKNLRCHSFYGYNYYP